MEYNELQDIMLEKTDEEKGAKKTKRILLAVAALLILFLGVLVIMKILNTEPSPDAISQTDSRLILPPEPVKKPTQVDKVVVSNDTNDQKASGNPKDDNLFEQVPIIPQNKTNDDFEEMVKALKNKDKSKENLDQTPKEPEESAPVASEPKEVKVVEPKVEKKKDVAKQEPKINVVKPKEPAKPEKKAEVKKEPEAKKEKVAKKPKPAKDSHSGEVANGSYVQVFAISKFDENSAEIRKLKANGYSYSLYNANVNGKQVIKVLVGPFEGNELKSELSKIRKNVASGAFILHVK